MELEPRNEDTVAIISDPGLTLPDIFDVTDDIPDAVLMYIFSFLTIRDLKRAARVCIRYYVIACDDIFWKPVFERYMQQHIHYPEQIVALDIVTSDYRNKLIQMRKHARNEKLYFKQRSKFERRLGRWTTLTTAVCLVLWTVGMMYVCVGGSLLLDGKFSLSKMASVLATIPLWLLWIIPPLLFLIILSVMQYINIRKVIVHDGITLWPATVKSFSAISAFSVLQPLYVLYIPFVAMIFAIGLYFNVKFSFLIIPLYLYCVALVVISVMLYQPSKSDPSEKIALGSFQVVHFYIIIQLGMILAKLDHFLPTWYITFTPTWILSAPFIFSVFLAPVMIGLCIYSNTAYSSVRFSDRFTVVMEFWQYFLYIELLMVALQVWLVLFALQLDGIVMTFSYVYLFIVWYIYLPIILMISVAITYACLKDLKILKN
jgi:hypothetical protein